MLCNEIKICKRAASTHAPERHYFRLKRDAMFPLSLPSLLSQLCRRQWNGLLVSAVPIMIVCLMKGSTLPPSLSPLLNKEEDIKLKSQARSNGRSERVGGGEMLHTYLYYTTSGAIPVARRLLFLASSAIQDYFISADSALTDNNNTKEEEEATQAAEA